MSYTPGVGGDPALLAQCISSNIQKITQCCNRSSKANVENSEVHVQQANQQLSRAAEYQHKSRKTRHHFYHCHLICNSRSHRMENERLNYKGAQCCTTFSNCVRNFL
ncbi:Hypothetical predicted protein [Lynx pardinus]|uniref:t-SNARE coiled-coil homology domain-containing protein n=1 Tax=Lynx pardinus TaxID=191816 RepID=A0A485NLT6_LYNPA|nr:Hypothetical predicted protein [Lynx pardinus]